MNMERLERRIYMALFVLAMTAIIVNWSGAVSVSATTRQNVASEASAPSATETDSAPVSLISEIAQEIDEATPAEADSTEVVAEIPEDAIDNEIVGPDDETEASNSEMETSIEAEDATTASIASVSVEQIEDQPVAVSAKPAASAAPVVEHVVSETVNNPVDYSYADVPETSVENVAELSVEETLRDEPEESEETTPQKERSARSVSSVKSVEGSLLLCMAYQDNGLYCCGSGNYCVVMNGAEIGEIRSITVNGERVSVIVCDNEGSFSFIGDAQNHPFFYGDLQF